MNFLAHLLLCDGDDQRLVGGLAGDFVRGVDLSSLPAGVRRGVALHRAVDRFTDAHPLFARSRARLPDAMRHWRGVLVDVFYDHVLARDFEAHAAMPLRAFADRVYGLLAAHRDWLPPRLQRAAPVMIEHDWLCAYAHPQGVAEILGRMGARTRRESPLAQAAALLPEIGPGLADDFAGFFPQVREHVAGL